MKRPLGVIASGIVAILGSIVALLFAVSGIASLFITPLEPRPANTAAAVVGGAVKFAVIAGIGIWTSVGLFLLRPWARTSVLILGILLACFSVFGLVVTMVMWIPQDVSTVHTYRQAMALLFGIPLLVGIWWIVQFNTASTKAAFSSSVAPSARPLGVTVLAWMSIVGGLQVLFAIVSRMPAFLFGTVFHGWGAGVIYAIFAAVTLYIGKGLLDLRERARVLAIVWVAFGLVHWSIVALVPSWRQRLTELERSLVPNPQSSIGFDPGIAINVMLASAAIVAAISIWILTRDRYAFVRAENSRDWPGLHGSLG
jgi:hypothetical protein